MPHLFANRTRLHALTRDPSDRRSQFRWETINAMAYLLGGAIFLAGSVLFFPRFSPHAGIGAILFFFGSLLYLLVTGHDLAEAVRYRGSSQGGGSDTGLELTAAIAYVVGTVLFTVGSILFLPAIDMTAVGAWCFVIGSALFVAGAAINILQIVKARSMKTMQLMNLTAVSFVVGAVLFTVASVPYLWQFHSADDRKTLYAFLAAQFVVGSVLFLLGGIFNYWRAGLVSRNDSDG